jgi:hypothetical protein
MNLYMSGSLVQSLATFLNASGIPTNPTVITFKWRAGAGVTNVAVYPAAPVVLVSAGIFYANIDTTGWAGPGNLLYTTEWVGTGTVQAIQSDYWQVEPPSL